MAMYINMGTFTGMKIGAAKHVISERTVTHIEPIALTTVGR